MLYEFLWAVPTLTCCSFLVLLHYDHNTEVDGYDPVLGPASTQTENVWISCRGPVHNVTHAYPDFPLYRGGAYSHATMQYVRFRGFGQDIYYAVRQKRQNCFV